MDAETARPRGVDVWLISCEPSEELGSPADLLSVDERERADRFHRELDRNRFRVIHTAMRMILAQYLNVRPQEVSFSSAMGVKPALASQFRGAGIQFNLSHSDAVALVAVAWDRAVGVDVERIDPRRDVLALADRALDPPEAASVRTAPPESRAAFFYRAWARRRKSRCILFVLDSKGGIYQGAG